MATGSETTSVPAGTAIVVSGGTFSWPQVPSTRWWVGVGSDATTTVAAWHTTRVVNRSLVSAWNASAPADVVSVASQYESGESDAARTPAYDQES